MMPASMENVGPLFVCVCVCMAGTHTDRSSLTCYNTNMKVRNGKTRRQEGKNAHHLHLPDTFSPLFVVLIRSFCSCNIMMTCSSQ